MVNIVPLRQSKVSFSEVERFITRAFSTAEHADGTEAALAAHLRSAPQRAIPSLEFIAIEDSSVCGYVLLSRTVVTKANGSTIEAVLAAPLCVELSKRRLGLGTKLMQTALGAAKKAGESFALVLGDPAYYARFGFVPFKSAGLTIAGNDANSCRQMLPYAQWLDLTGHMDETVIESLSQGRADLLVDEVFEH